MLAACKTTHAKHKSWYAVCSALHSGACAVALSFCSFCARWCSLTRANCAQPMTYFSSLLVLLIGLKLVIVAVRMSFSAGAPW